LEVAGSDALAQKPSLARARTLAHLVTVVLRALEVGSLEERVSVLETVQDLRMIG
jgi:hypothetical protein